ncbi:hypothetical protein GXP74_37245 [Streptacidiphilus sp. P02-A3a]|nr:hypothetical protein GXP74_37245 [Streptacidiphilus sp. P02-A3a]
MVAFTGILTSGTTPARADTGYGQIKQCWMNLGAAPNSNQQRMYAELIGSLRQAAGHTYRGSVYQTQGVSYSLIRLSLTFQERTVVL